MPNEESQAPEPPIESRIEAKSIINDPRDDLREQVAVHRRDLQAFLALRVLPRRRPDVSRQ